MLTDEILLHYALYSVKSSKSIYLPDDLDTMLQKIVIEKVVGYF